MDGGGLLDYTQSDQPGGELTKFESCFNVTGGFSLYDGFKSGKEVAIETPPKTTDAGKGETP
jgi:hypothetical protein